MESDKSESISSRVIRLRRALGFSQRELGRRADTSGSYINQLESGLMPRPGAKLLEGIARALGVSVGYLMTGTDDNEHTGFDARLVDPIATQAAKTVGEKSDVIRKINVSLSKLGDFDLDALSQVDAIVATFVERAEKADKEERDAIRRRHAAKQAGQDNSEV